MKTQEGQTQDARLEPLVIRGTCAEVLAELAALRAAGCAGPVVEYVELPTREGAR